MKVLPSSHHFRFANCSAHFCLRAIACLATAGVLSWIPVRPAGRPIPQKEDQARGAVVRVGVTMVTVGVRVTDRNAREVRGLKREDFSIYEDNIPQPVAFFAEEEQPVSVGILLDQSQSMGESNKLTRAKMAAIYLTQAGHADNEYLYIPFDDRANVSVDFTSDRGRVMSAIFTTTLGEGTSLYDAILLALDRFKNARYGRQVLVVITDGTDQHSVHTLDDVVVGLQESQVQLYLIGYFSEFEDRLFRSGVRNVMRIDGVSLDNPRLVFKRLSEETGAESFFPESDQQLRQTVESLSEDVRRQYTLAYYPSRPFRDDAYRQIEVKVRRRGVRIRARQGYRPVKSEE